MSCQHIGAVHICSFTDFDDLRIVAAGRSFRFEFSHRFGPALLDKRGETRSTLPPMRSPFWKALQLWCKQDHRVEDGQAVYNIPAPGQMFVRITGRQWLARAERTGKPANGYTADDLRTKVALFERLSTATDADVIAHVDQNAARMRDRLAELRRG